MEMETEEMRSSEQKETLTREEEVQSAIEEARKTANAPGEKDDARVPETTDDPENDKNTSGMSGAGKEEAKAEQDPEDGDEEKTTWEEVLEDAQEEAGKTQDNQSVSASFNPDGRDELKERLMRQMAEFENFRRRSEREKSAMFDMGVRHVVERILPVIDNFERGLAGLDPEAKDPFAEGMEMVYRQMMDALTEMGVSPIEALGQPFNPELHNAVMHVEDENASENEIVEEFQKGYTYHDSVVRHSMVKVAN